MRMLFAALGLAAVLTQSAAATARPQTLYSSPGPIDAFAQDGTLLAWFAPAAKGCNKVWVLDLSDAVQVQLPEQSASAVNVTCSWDVAPPVRLALDVDPKTTTALWTLRERAPLRFDYLLGASLKDRLERRFQEIAHASRGAGLWLGDIAGDDGTLVYSVASVEFVDEVACLSTPKAPNACALRIGDGGGVYRIVGRSKITLVPGTNAGAIELAVAGENVAYVPAGGVASDGHPVEASEIDVRSAGDGNPLARVFPQGTPVALALSSSVLASIEREPSGALQLSWYDARTGSRSGSIPISSNAALELTANTGTIVYRVGLNLHAVDVADGTDHVVAHALGTPIGLSLQGSRLAWAENAKGGGRIRALTLP